MSQITNNKDKENFINALNDCGLQNPVSPDGLRIALLRKELNEFERCVTLLKATYDLLNKQVESPFVLNILEEMVFYDGVDCDGYCLMDDIADEIMIIERDRTSI